MSEHIQPGTDHHSGLEEVKAVPSSITSIEGARLRYRGILIEDLATAASFEETVYLLWYGRLPGEKELRQLKADFQERSHIPDEIFKQLNHTPKNAHPMAILRSLVSSLALYDEGADTLDTDSNFEKGISIMAQIPILVAAIARHKKSKANIESKADLGYSANFLQMLDGDAPEEIAVKTLNTCLNLYAEHELNASTFAARVATGTLTDMYSAVTTAISALKGILHGGANEQAMEMILDISRPDMAVDWVKDALSEKKRIMGFGHRVYKEGDPRAKILRQLNEEICKQKGFENYFEIAMKVEETMKQEKGLLPNVDFYSALCFYALGFATDMFTSVFAVARCAGWIAHILEQYENNRLIRPRAEYTGSSNVEFISLEKR